MTSEAIVAASAVAERIVVAVALLLGIACGRSSATARPSLRSYSPYSPSRPGGLSRRPRVQLGDGVASAGRALAPGAAPVAAFQMLRARSSNGRATLRVLPSRWWFSRW